MGIRHAFDETLHFVAVTAAAGVAIAGVAAVIGRLEGVRGQNIALVAAGAAGGAGFLSLVLAVAGSPVGQVMLGRYATSDDSGGDGGRNYTLGFFGAAVVLVGLAALIAALSTI